MSSIDQYELIRSIGEGAFGKVYLMRHRVERVLCCVKTIKIKNIPKKEREACRMEVNLLRRMTHPNIVGYKESFLSKNQDKLCIVMQYADGGDLAGQIKIAHKQSKLFAETKILHWFVQMCLGLHYMHSNRVLHRDLKTQNIFLLGNGRLVLGDLGISKVLEGTMDFAQTCIGTPYYMSPEIFKNKPYNHKSDIWALGCVLYEMTTLNHAFDASSLNGLACKIVKGRYPPISTRYSKSLRDLISAMLATAPSSRPMLDRILQKPFVKTHIRDFLGDIVSRPAKSVGEGTMAVRVAALAVVSDQQGPGGPSGVVGGSADQRAAHAQLGNNAEVTALREQLDVLNMQDVITEAFQPKRQVDARQLDARQAERAAKEQAAALRREEERRRQVEAALNKLKEERALRLRDKERLLERAREDRVRQRRRDHHPAPNHHKYANQPRAPWGAGAGVLDSQAAARAVRGSRASAASEVRKSAADRQKRDRDLGLGGAAAAAVAVDYSSNKGPRRMSRPKGGGLAAENNSHRRASDEAQKVADLERWENDQQRAQQRGGPRRSEPSSYNKGGAPLQQPRGGPRPSNERRSSSEAVLLADEKAAQRALDARLAEAKRAKELRAAQREADRDREVRRKREILDKLREDKVALDKAERERVKRRDQRLHDVELELAKQAAEGTAAAGGDDASSTASSSQPKRNTNRRRSSLSIAAEQKRDEASSSANEENTVDGAIERARAAAQAAGAFVIASAAPAEDKAPAMQFSSSNNNNTYVRRDDKMSFPPSSEAAAAAAVAAAGAGGVVDPFAGNGLAREKNPFAGNALPRDSDEAAPGLARRASPRIPAAAMGGGAPPGPTYASHQQQQQQQQQPSSSSSFYAAAETKAEPTARERVLMRKQEAAEQEEAARLAMLNAAHAAASKERRAARALAHDQYRSSFDTPAVSAIAAEQRYADQRAAGRRGPPAGGGGLAAHDEGKGVALDDDDDDDDDDHESVAISSLYGGQRGVSVPASESPPAPPRRRSSLGDDQRENNNNITAVDVISDDETDDGHGRGAVKPIAAGGGGMNMNMNNPLEDPLAESDESDDDDDDDSVGWAAPNEETIEEADADIEHREEELKEELAFATQRCEELRKTLQDTKTAIVEAKTKTRATPSGGAAPAAFLSEHKEDDRQRSSVRDRDIPVESWRSKLSERDEEEEEDVSDDEEDPEPPGGRRRSPPGGGASSSSSSASLPVMTPPREKQRAMDQPPIDELTDAVSPTGRLADRIRILRDRCIRALGAEPFNRAYSYLKSLQDADDDHLGLEAGGEAYYGGLQDNEVAAQKKLRNILGADMAHYSSLIDQLIFMEESL